MIRVSLSRRFGALVLACLLPLAVHATDRHFTTSNTQSAEARTLVQLLQNAHYNRDAVSPKDYQQAVVDYMTALDGQHLFFLGTDKANFNKTYGKVLYENISTIGNIDAAYEIFYVYDQRTQDRVKWIFEELKKDFDLTTGETYRADRVKSEWPESAAAADDLWRKRLKFELVQELLNKKTLDQAKDTIHKRYERILKYVAEFEGADLSELFLTTIAQLYDPHTDYWSAATYEDFGIQMKLQLEGIGALLGREEDNCLVKEIVPGGPADLGRQLKPGDKIITVAQEGQEPVEIMGMKLRKVVSMIRGVKGTNVHLVVEPADAVADTGVRKEIIITRDKVKLNSARARAAVFQVPGPEGKDIALGVVSLPSFYASEEGDTDSDRASASQDVARLLVDLKSKNVQGVVLDLRHNGGGYLSEAIDLAGLFIKTGPVVQVKNYNGQTQVDTDDNPSIAYDGPLAVLVDRFSASASEITAGALQNYGRAIIVGDSSTHGKGTVQQVVEMKNLPGMPRVPIEKSGATKLTIQKYYLPNGSSTQKNGVVPDIILPSINEFLTGITEAELPHVLAWDEIPRSFFDGVPLQAKFLAPLRQLSLERQSKLEEFSYLKENVDWFKARQAQKLISVNLEDRRKQKADDDAFRKKMNAERERLAKNDYPFEQFRLGPPPPPKIKPVKKEKDPGDEDDDDDSLSTDENDTYTKVDVHLRESLRVVLDAIKLGQNHDTWVSDHAPITAATKG